MPRADLSHTIPNGLETYKGLPAPAICDFWTHESSRERYDDGSEFQIARIDLVGNTGTYLDAPFHRFADGCDLAGLNLDQVAGLEGIVIHWPWQRSLAVPPQALDFVDFQGKAVLFHTNWSDFWGTEAYFTGHPFLSEELANLLVDGGARLVGLDAYNVDDTRTRRRPVHTTLLARSVLIVEHMTNLTALPDKGFRFSSVPPKYVGMGSFPVRAWAEW